MKSLIVLCLMFATHISMAADADKEPIAWMVPSVRTLVDKGDASFSIFKVEVDIRRTGFKCYHKKDGGLTVHKMIGNKAVPIKISGLKDGVLGAIRESFNIGRFIATE